MYLLYECKAFSSKYTSGKINLWKSTGVNNYCRDSDMDAVSVATTSLPPLIDNERMSVRLEGAYFKQMRLLRPNNDNIVNIYIAYLIDPNNKANNIYVMGDLFVQGINDTTLYAEKIYSQNFTAANKKFVLSLHYNGDDSYLFVNGKRELKFKAKDDQIVKEILCLGNISDDWTAANAQKTGFWG